MKIKHIVWDWNGTLLDDLWLSVQSINIVLKRHDLPQVSNKKYLHLFVFPVINYYKKLGFDFKKKSFEIIGTEFIKEYSERQFQPKLHHGAEKLLMHISSMGITQSLLSAATNKMLDMLISHHGLNKFFIKIKGQNNHYAYGKTESGKALISELDLDPTEILFIGDTIHDSEVANDIGVNCALLSYGHTHHSRLRETNAIVFESLSKLRAWLLQNVNPIV